MTHLFSFGGWLLSTLLILLLALALHFFVTHLSKKLIPKLKNTHFAWDFSLVKALNLPLKALAWALALSFVLEIVSEHFESETFAYFFQTLRTIAIILFFVWSLMRFIKNMEMQYTKGHRRIKKGYDKTTVRAVCQIGRIVLIIVAILVYLQTRQINISAFLAVGGAGSLVLGLAAKDLLANFFGGLMIYLDRPFSVGDWIRSPDKEIEGHVETIGWRLTRIRTFSKRPLYVPNGVFSNISVENPSRMSNRRIKARVGIRYEDARKMGQIVSAVEEMLRNNEEVDTQMRLVVRFDEFGPSSLNFLIYCFTKATQLTDYLTVQQTIYLKVIEIIESYGAQCAFPTTTVHIPEGIQSQDYRKP